jgi:hypothetical protein
MSEYGEVVRGPFDCPSGTYQHNWRVTASANVNLARSECRKCGDVRFIPAPATA